MAGSRGSNLMSKKLDTDNLMGLRELKKLGYMFTFIKA